MFATDDTVIDPAQSWDYDRKKENTRPHNCPTWARLSGWAGTEPATCIVMGVHSAERYVAPRVQAGHIGLKEYARKMNKDSLVLSALVRHYKIPMDNKKMKLFAVETLDMVCAKHWPQSGLISRARALDIVRKAVYLPKCVMEIEGVKFYEESKCLESHDTIKRERKAAHSLNLKLRHEQSRQLRARREESDKKEKIKKRIARELARKPKKAEPETIPDGYIYLVDAVGKYGIHRNTLARFYKRGLVRGRILRQKTILSIEDIEIQAACRKSARPDPLPDGFLYLSQAAKQYDMPKNTLFRAYKKGWINGRLNGLQVIISVADIEKYIQKRKDEKNKPKPVKVVKPKPIRAKKPKRSKEERNRKAREKYIKKPEPIAPDGHIDIIKAIALSCKSYRSIYVALKREKFKSVQIRKIWFIEESSFRHWMMLQPELL